MEATNFIRTDTKNEAIKCLEKLDETLLLIREDPYQWKWAIIVLHNCVQNCMVLGLEGTNQAAIILDKTGDKKYIKKHLSPGKQFLYVNPDDFTALYEKSKSGDAVLVDFLNIYKISGLVDNKLSKEFESLYEKSKLGNVDLKDFQSLYFSLYNKIKLEDPKLECFLSLYQKIKSKDHMHLYINSKIFESTIDHFEAMVAINDIRNNFIHFFPKGWSIQIIELPTIFGLISDIIEFLLFESGNCLYKFDDKEIFNIKNCIKSIRRTLKEM